MNIFCFCILVRRGDVLAAWSGIRPLVVDPSSKDTKSVSRNHVIEVSDNNLITIAGGKWTTYRSMASDTVDAAIKACNLQAGGCKTDGLMLEGGEGWTPTFFIRLVQDFGLEPEVCVPSMGRICHVSFHPRFPFKVLFLCSNEKETWFVLSQLHFFTAGCKASRKIVWKQGPTSRQTREINWKEVAGCW